MSPTDPAAGSEAALPESPSRPQLLAHLRPRLSELCPTLRGVVAENLLGAGSRIDFVGVERSGRVVLVLVGEPGEDLELVGRALAQRAWVAARVADWLKLAPGLGAREAAGVRAVLLCPSFREESAAAVAALGPEVLTRARYRLLRRGSRTEALVEAAGGGEVRRAGPETPAAPEPALPPFRTGLTDADLSLPPGELGSS